MIVLLRTETRHVFHVSKCPDLPIMIKWDIVVDSYFTSQCGHYIGGFRAGGGLPLNEGTLQKPQRKI